MRAQTYHRLNRKCHPRLRCTDCLILRVMRDIGCGVEELVDSVPAIRCNHAALLALCMSCDDIPRILESHARLDDLDCLV